MRYQPTIDLSRTEVARVAKVCDRLRAGYPSRRAAAEALGVPSNPFHDLLRRPSALTVQEYVIDAIAKAAKVSREDLLAGRAGA